MDEAWQILCVGCERATFALLKATFPTPTYRLCEASLTEAVEQVRSDWYKVVILEADLTTPEPRVPLVVLHPAKPDAMGAAQAEAGEGSEPALSAQQHGAEANYSLPLLDGTSLHEVVANAFQRLNRWRKHLVNP